jgi:hypothetical protein
MTIFAMVTMVQLATARDNGSILNLRLSDNSPFRVFVDGQQVGGVSRTATIAHLAQGNYYLEIYPVGNAWRNERQRRNFKGNVRVERNTEAFVTVFPEYRKLQYDRIVALGLDKKNWHDRGRHDHPKNPRYNPEACGTVPAGPMSMNQTDFMQLRNSIDRGSFESTKLNIFKQALAYNYFTTGQIRELMSLFSFENSKLEVAKLAYPKTVDPQNYYALNNEFSFSSSVDELGDFIAMR